MAGWKIGLLVGLAVLIAVPIVALQVLPGWGTLIVLLLEVGLIVALGPQLIRWGVRQLTMEVLGRKSRVLSGAGVVIHDVRPVEPPAHSVAEGEKRLAEGARHVQVECTITPRPGTGEMQFYEPGEFLLVPYDAPVSETEHPEEEEVAAAEAVWVLDETGAAQADPGKLRGPARLRILFACPPALRGRVKLRYYFEALGDLAVD